ncbi:hydrolytic protein [Streptomyces sp. NPDC005805]|uniref:COG1470 family protein n=1 Tax=Streptomyces sp. NPDC005805 TaxID=3157068 RepID=UPI0033ECDDF1
MTSPAASSGPGATSPDLPEVTVAPGGTATTSLTVRNDGDIVEAYTLEVVGDCAAWATVEPARVSLYPGTSETVTVTLAPPRSPQVRAGAVPLAVRVLPAEHPDAVRVPETTVHIEEFRELRTALEPRRRRGWLRARYRVALRNEGNAPVRLRLVPGQPGEELGFAFTPEESELAPGESVEAGLRVRTGKPVWFGDPVVFPFTVEAADAAEGGEEADPKRAERTEVRTPLDAEFVQIPVFPKWLLAVLAALLALLLAWFMLVRPAVRSTAKDAAQEVVQPRPTPGGEAEAPGTGDGGGTGGPGTGGESGQQPGGGTGEGSGPGQGPGTGPGDAAGGGQSSATIDVESAAGETKSGTYTVPEGMVFGVTDIVLANFQGDEGVLTISFGERKITTIALETFRNQDYHWVTPIRIAENETVTAEVTCAKPGTPATGQRARGCHQVLNVSGVLSRAR